MRFQRIIEQVYGKPWLITPAAWESIHSLVSNRIAQPSAERPTEDIFGDKLRVMEKRGSIAVIPVEGVIGRKLGMLEKTCGAVDTEDISNDFESAMADGSVTGIVLDVNSPGGSVSGVPELAALIASAQGKKPVYAFANDMMASAAYYISAGAERIYASPSSSVGSIGVYVPWIDKSEAYKAMGISVDVIKSGKFKGMGYPGTTLTEDQRQLIQDEVNETYDDFASFVESHRTGASREAMQGQTLSGAKAADAKLVTHLRNSLKEVLVDISNRA